MHRPFARGSVVVRGGAYAVVWADRGRLGLELLPVITPTQHLAGDVLLDLADLIAMQVPVANAVIRPLLMPSTGDGYVRVGAVPAERTCEMVRCVIRAANTIAHEAKWAGDRAHRSRARDNRVPS